MEKEKTASQEGRSDLEPLWCRKSGLTRRRREPFAREVRLDTGGTRFAPSWRNSESKTKLLRRHGMLSGTSGGKAAGKSPEMGRMTVGDNTTEQLARSLTRVAANPSMTGHLHDVLGGYCHECRNQLNSLKITLYLVRKSGLAGKAISDELEPLYKRLETFVDRLQQVCRPMPLSLVRLPFSLLVDDRKSTWTTWLSERGRRLVVVPPADPATASFDPMRIGQAFDDLVAWRASAGDRANDLRLRWKTEGETFRLDWDEPERESDPENTDEPKEVWDEGTESLSALTVPLLTRIMTLHGGFAEESGPGRWGLRLRWPLDARPNLRETP